LYPEAAAAAGRKGELKLGFWNRWHSLKMLKNACVRNVGCLPDRLKASGELSESCPLDLWEMERVDRNISSARECHNGVREVSQPLKRPQPAGRSAINVEESSGRSDGLQQVDAKDRALTKKKGMETMVTRPGQATERGRRRSHCSVESLSQLSRCF
jgi:hypothetical protein